MNQNHHVAVMAEEAIAHLKIKPNGIYWDGTYGRGGHSSRILEHLGPEGRLIASDRDHESQLAFDSGPKDHRATFIRGPYSQIVDEVPVGLSGFLLDIGVSTPQLLSEDRGFSFQTVQPLDMRMDQSQSTTASDLVNQLAENELADLIYQYGEERLSRRIARFVVEQRRKASIEDTRTLADICYRAYPKRHYHRIHPATRTFQALRIAVNSELDELETCLPSAMDKLMVSGRGVVICFHSLEDRIVKHLFRNASRGGPYGLITKKPLIPTDEERAINPASRSAKMRVIERSMHDE